MYVSALLTQEPSVIFSCLLFVGLRAGPQVYGLSVGPGSGLSFREKIGLQAGLGL